MFSSARTAPILECWRSWIASRPAPTKTFGLIHRVIKPPWPSANRRSKPNSSGRRIDQEHRPGTVPLVYLSFAGPFLFAPACRNTNSICAFTLRRSSAAHFSISFHRSGEILSRKGLRCSEDTSGVKRAGIDYGRCVRISAEYDQKIADHCSLAFIVELHDVLLIQFVQRHVNHADRVLHDDLSGCDNRLRLLTPQHDRCDFWRVRKVREARLLDDDTGFQQARLQLFFKRRGHFIRAAAQGDLVLLTLVVCVATRDAANG